MKLSPIPEVGSGTAQGRHYARLLRGYALSRRLPGYWLLMLVLLGMVAWGGEWGLNHAPTTLRMLVFVLPVATTSVLGVSLFSPFGETERAAGTWLPLGRALHLLSMLLLALAVNAIALATWILEGDPIPWESYLLRHTLLLAGVALLAARAIDSRLSWVAPSMVAMPGLVTGFIRFEQAVAEDREVAFFHDSWHPMLRPDGDAAALVVAVGLFVAGIAVVIRRGERPAEPEETAG